MKYYYCAACSLNLQFLRGKWQGMLRILPGGEAVVHLQDMSTIEVDIRVQSRVQNREVEATAERGVEAENVTST